MWYSSDRYKHNMQSRVVAWKICGEYVLYFGRIMHRWMALGLPVLWRIQINGMTKNRKMTKAQFVLIKQLHCWAQESPGILTALFIPPLQHLFNTCYEKAIGLFYTHVQSIIDFINTKHVCVIRCASRGPLCWFKNHDVKEYVRDRT